MDRRAQATGIANFFLALLVGAAVAWVVSSITSRILPRSRNATSDPVGNEAVAYSTDFIANQPVLFLFTAFFSLIALAIFQREILR